MANRNSLDITDNIEKNKKFEISEFFDKNKLLYILNCIYNLKNLDLKNILYIYKSLNDSEICYDDIYYYLYHYRKNNYLYGKYTNKAKNYKSSKQIFRKKCFKFDIDKSNRLLKNILMKNIITNKTLLKELIVIPPKYIEEFINSYHIKNGHKGYYNLVNDIINDGYYIKGIYEKCKSIIKNCLICTQSKKMYLKYLLLCK